MSVAEDTSVQLNAQLGGKQNLVALAQAKLMLRRFRAATLSHKKATAADRILDAIGELELSEAEAAS